MQNCLNKELKQIFEEEYSLKKGKKQILFIETTQFDSYQILELIIKHQIADIVRAENLKIENLQIIPEDLSETESVMAEVQTVKTVDRDV